MLDSDISATVTKMQRGVGKKCGLADIYIYGPLKYLQKSTGLSSIRKNKVPLVS